MKNIGTGKYLHDATPAKYDDPVYFTFCTISPKSGIETLSILNPQPSAIYTLQGVRVVGTENLKPGIYIRDGRKFIVKP